MSHALELTDRGPQHRHRWQPACTCGQWAGIPLRSKKSAVEEYRRHVARSDQQATTRRAALTTGGRRSYARYGPAPVTPADRLPPELR